LLWQQSRAFRQKLPVTAAAEQQLLVTALDHLRALLPEDFRLDSVSLEPDDSPAAVDATCLLVAPNHQAELLAHAKLSFGPRDVERFLGEASGMLRRVLGNRTVLVIAPWLSPRARASLEARGCSYLDLTGNVRLQVTRPAVYLRLQGSDKDPNPPERSLPGLQGPRARRLVRLLVDVTPPYRMTDLARTADLNPGYVSRLLGSLDEQALIERGRRGVVEDVDWAALLEAAAEKYDFLKSNDTTMYVAPAGAAALHARLTAGEFPGTVVTGSYAAAAVAPVAAPSQLAVCTTDPVKIRRGAGLLPADRGADVLLLEPADPSQMERPRLVEGAMHVGRSQLVIDLLAGTGRMPEEGAAVLDWMRDHEAQWRLPDLSAVAATHDAT
jgi:DNA-binding MarR family transcriptional regulator